MSDERARTCANAIVRRIQAKAESHPQRVVPWEELRVEVFHAIANTKCERCRGYGYMTHDVGNPSCWRCSGTGKLVHYTHDGVPDLDECSCVTSKAGQ